MSAITVLNTDNVPTGPFTREEIAQKLQTGEFNLQSLAFIEGLSQWTPLRDVLAQVDATATPPTPPVIASGTAAPAYSYAATMQPPGHLQHAGFWIRVAAHILDNLIVSIPFGIIWVGVVMVVFGASTFAPLMRSNSGQVDPALVASLVGTIMMLYLTLIFGRLIVVWLYHAILESGTHQSTWGKRILGLKVTSLSGQRISFAHATGRYFSSIITALTVGIGYLMVAFTERKQTLHDMIAGTVVVKQ